MGVIFYIQATQYNLTVNSLINLNVVLLWKPTTHTSLSQKQEEKIKTSQNIATKILTSARMYIFRMHINQIPKIHNLHVLLSAVTTSPLAQTTPAPTVNIRHSPSIFLQKDYANQQLLIILHLGTLLTNTNTYMYLKQLQRDLF